MHIEVRRNLATFLVLGVALTALILLAAGMPRLAFSPPSSSLPGRMLVLGQTPDDTLASSSHSARADWFWLAAGALLLLAITGVYLFASPATRRWLVNAIRGWLVNALVLAVLTVVSLILIQMASHELPAVPVGSAPSAGNAAEELIAQAVPPAWLRWLAAAVMASLLAVALTAAARLAWRRARPPAGVLAGLGQEAEDALSALQAGADLRDVVLQCYLEMVHVLDAQRGIVRPQAMTVREFEARLRQAGLPDQPVHELTRLFESVRYGDKMTGQPERDRAVFCLQTILAACGG